MLGFKLGKKPKATNIKMYAHFQVTLIESHIVPRLTKDLNGMMSKVIHNGVNKKGIPVDDITV